MTLEESNKQEILALRKNNREIRNALQSLSDSILLYVDWMDTRIGPEKSISKPISSLIAKGINALVLVNDHVRYGSLGVAFRTDNKKEAIKKLKKWKDREEENKL